MRARFFFAAFAVFAFLVFTGCGRKGPPLPPLLKQPTAPQEMRAERHGELVDIDFVVPSTNGDGTRPANIERVDVYALTAARAIDEGEVLKYGTRIASLPVKAPRDPNVTAEPDEHEEIEFAGKGLNQGAAAHVEERLSPEVMKPADIPTAPVRKNATAPAPPLREGPLVPTVLPRPKRLYVGVSVTTKGRNAALTHAVVSMIEVPPRPAMPTATYNEKAITIGWAPVPIGDGAAAENVLPSRPIGLALPSVAYNVYEVSESTPPSLTRLTQTPISALHLTDSRMSWGERRCYAVRAYVTIEDVSLEGDESPPYCVTLTDTFPPAAPTGLQAVPSEGAISLIWDANTEPDIRGYIVLRGPVGAEKLDPVVKEPVQETSFQDRAESGVRFAYAVQAIDNAGNLSLPSARVEETAR